ncbi:hypothetical protein KXD93_27090 [Mucilaginibacter sp. BJC16-A38]|uniref:hypothetical protein n=1 Tax=Mucilaginibacter phenanthrenivorans TaxID=1234842 RepID=UPI00215877B5|nr:hypothetical protein [Mucilaginibacter phenanthrenivorans]MCR8561348.1 hypothetical protein [Mucilaginibacter phenanthrenivorans]
MKLNLTRTLVLLAVIVVCYASCKKQNAPSAGNTTKAVIDYKALSSTIGTQFYKSITGQYGGTDVNKGITSPDEAVAANKKFSLNSIAPLCGTIIDTTYKTETVNPATASFTTHFENFHFTYTCDAGRVDGYLVRDSLVNVSVQNLFASNTYAVTQNYAVKALDQTYKYVSMDGSLSSLVATGNSEALSVKSTASIYYLVGLRVNFASGPADITAGTTSFKTTTTVYGPETSYIHNVTTYYGTIQYLGNHKAKVTFIPGAAYIVDLITGVATPA